MLKVICNMQPGKSQTNAYLLLVLNWMVYLHTEMLAVQVIWKIREKENLKLLNRSSFLFFPFSFWLF